MLYISPSSPRFYFISSLFFYFPFLFYSPLFFPVSIIYFLLSHPTHLYLPTTNPTLLNIGATSSYLSSLRPLLFIVYFDFTSVFLSRSSPILQFPKNNASPLSQLVNTKLTLFYILFLHLNSYQVNSNNNSNIYYC